MDRLQLGIVGLRNQGREHLGADGLLKYAKIAAVCDTDERELDKALAEHGELRVHSSVEEMLTDTRLDGLVLALPHHAYANLWERIVARKLPILKEKPLGRSLSEAFWLFETARRNGCFLQTAIQRRSHPSYAYLKTLLAGHQIHSVMFSLHLGFDPVPDPAGWRGVPEHAGGGAVLDFGYHAIDLLLFLLDDLQLVSASLWRGDKPATAERLESEARLICRSGAAWVHIDLRVGGEPDPEDSGRFLKKELLTIDCDAGRIVADRSKVRVNDETVFECKRGWEQAMASQLDEFALNVLNRTYDQESVWGQIPAMKLVEQIYTGAGIVRPPEKSGKGGSR